MQALKTVSIVLKSVVAVERRLGLLKHLRHLRTHPAQPGFVLKLVLTHSGDDVLALGRQRALDVLPGRRR